MSKLRRIVGIGLALVLAIVAGTFIYSYAWLRSTLPPTSGTVTVAGPDARIEIDFDTMGIPQVWAASDRDAWFALGWLHAADRLFQMELLRRVADGRLSEIFGDATFASDIEHRRIGHRRMAAAAMDNLEVPARAALEAYAAGVNAYVGQATLPFEFRLLGAAFAPWTVEDSLAVTSFQVWYSDDLSNTETFLVTRVLDGMAPDEARTLLADAPGAMADAGLAIARRMVPDRAAAASLIASLKVSLASNAWAIAPSRSASGHAMLADDPHTQGRDLPGLWYIAGLHAPDLDVVGITAPGVPGVVMGHTRAAAWGMTASGVDLRDHYIERTNPDNPGEYLTPDGWLPFDVRTETIEVRGKAPVTLEVKHTRHGPVIRESSRTHEAVAWHWAGFDFSPAALVNSAMALPYVTDWASFWARMGSAGGGAFNWVFAGANGEIGYGMGSPIPIRPPGHDGVLPVDGATEAGDWTGYVPIDRKPRTVDPAEGWVANANDAPDTEGLGYTLSGPGFAADRIQRARARLAAAGRPDVEDMMAAQLDRVDLSVLRWKGDAIAALEPLSGPATSALRSWDGSMDRDSTTAAIVNLWLAALNREIFSDELGGPVPRVFFEAVLGRAESPWYDDTRTPEVETRDDLVRRAMKEALESAAGRTWGQIATLTLAHPMARVPVVGWFLRLSRGPFPWGGSAGSLNSNFVRFDAGGGYIQGITPAWRQIVDFADVDNALMAMPAGQSGNPMSPHFFDFWPLWRTGSYWKVPLTRERVQERLSSTLVLAPTQPSR